MAQQISGQLQCLIVTPEKQVADTNADFVILTAHDGQVGILPEHSAFLCRLAPGLLRIDRGQKKEYYFVSGGFAEVLDNRITVLTPQAIAADKLDPTAIDEELVEAGKVSMATEADRQRRQKALAIARGKQSVLLASHAKSG